VLGREQEDVERKSGARGLGMTFLWPRRHRERKGVEIPVQRHQVGKDGGHGDVVEAVGDRCWQLAGAVEVGGAVVSEQGME
jgi:hypothetical protein